MAASPAGRAGFFPQIFDHITDDQILLAWQSLPEIKDFIDRQKKSMAEMRARHRQELTDLLIDSGLDLSLPEPLQIARDLTGLDIVPLETDLANFIQKHVAEGVNSYLRSVIALFRAKYPPNEELCAQSFILGNYMLSKSGVDGGSGISGQYEVISVQDPMSQGMLESACGQYGSVRSLGSADESVDSRGPSIFPRGPVIKPREPSIDPREPSLDPGAPSIDFKGPSVDLKALRPLTGPRETMNDPREPLIDPSQPLSVLTETIKSPRIAPQDVKASSSNPSVDQSGFSLQNVALTLSQLETSLQSIFASYNGIPDDAKMMRECYNSEDLLPGLNSCYGPTYQSGVEQYLVSDQMGFACANIISKAEANGPDGGSYISCINTSDAATKQFIHTGSEEIDVESFQESLIAKRRRLCRESALLNEGSDCREVKLTEKSDDSHKQFSPLGICSDVMSASVDCFLEKEGDVSSLKLIGENVVFGQNCSLAGTVSEEEGGVCQRSVARLVSLESDRGCADGKRREDKKEELLDRKGYEEKNGEEVWNGEEEGSDEVYLSSSSTNTVRRKSMEDFECRDQGVQTNISLLLHTADQLDKHRANNEVVQLMHSQIIDQKELGFSQPPGIGSCLEVVNLSRNFVDDTVCESDYQGPPICGTGRNVKFDVLSPSQLMELSNMCNQGFSNKTSGSTDVTNSKMNYAETNGVNSAAFQAQCNGHQLCLAETQFSTVQTCESPVFNELSPVLVEQWLSSIENEVSSVISPCNVCHLQSFTYESPSLDSRGSLSARCSEEVDGLNNQAPSTNANFSSNSCTSEELASFCCSSAFGKGFASERVLRDKVKCPHKCYKVPGLGQQFVTHQPLHVASNPPTQFASGAWRMPPAACQINYSGMQQMNDSGMIGLAESSVRREDVSEVNTARSSFSTSADCCESLAALNSQFDVIKVSEDHRNGSQEEISALLRSMLLPRYEFSLNSGNNSEMNSCLSDHQNSVHRVPSESTMIPIVQDPSKPPQLFQLQIMLQQQRPERTCLDVTRCLDQSSAGLDSVNQYQQLLPQPQQSNQAAMLQAQLFQILQKLPHQEALQLLRDQPFLLQRLQGQVQQIQQLPVSSVLPRAAEESAVLFRQLSSESQYGVDQGYGSDQQHPVTQRLRSVEDPAKNSSNL